jgi:DNA-binding response OmpR family regulator
MPRVLVVDDDVAVRETLQRILQTVPYEFALASTAASAICLAETFKPDRAIIDFVLPDIDGIELTTTLKTANPKLRVTMISGVPDLKDQVGDLAKSAGVRNFVEKPFRAHEILEAIS